MGRSVDRVASNDDADDLVGERDEQLLKFGGVVK